MQINVADTPPQDSGAELVCVGLFEDEDLGEPFAGVAGSGDARGGFKKLALLHPDPPARLLVVGLGKRDEFDSERARVAAALAVREAGKLEASSIAWQLPDEGDSQRSRRSDRRRHDPRLIPLRPLQALR